MTPAWSSPTDERYRGPHTATGSPMVLTMGDYQRVLERPKVWERLGWPLHRATFISRLHEIRHVRNKVMHFHPDPLAAGTVELLRLFNSLLHRYRDPA